MTTSGVSFDGSRYLVFDDDSREVNEIYASSCGELRGFGEDFLICQDGDRYLIVNAENGSEIAGLYRSSVGEFKHANGRLIVFQDGSRIIVHGVGYSGVSEISSRYA